MEKISACVFTKNEEHNIEACIKSLQGVDSITIFDDSSTDKTKEIAEKMGATVITRHDTFDTPTEQDVKDFEKRFGWKPIFTTGPSEKKMETKFCQPHQIPPKESENFNRCIRKLNNDWVIFLCADERVTWDLPRIRKEILPIADQVECDFIFSHNSDGTPTSVAKRVYMYRKSVTKFGGRTHNCSIPYGRIVHCPFFKIDHWQTPNAVINGVAVHSQNYVLPIMEYSVLKEDDSRSRFYLGREYYYYNRFKEAITILELYLKDATWQPEIAHARLYKSYAHWRIMEGDKARYECLEAVKLNPDFKEALVQMSEMFYSPWKEKWAYIAKNATNKDILF